MSNKKHSHLRYNILDKYFRRRERPMTFQEILDGVNEEISEIFPGESIAERTLRGDLKLFRDKKEGFGAPLEVVRFQGRDVYLSIPITNLVLLSQGFCHLNNIC